MGVAVHGPIPQAYFLAGLGIEARLDALLERSSESEQASLIQGYNRIVGGQRSSAVKSDASGTPERIETEANLASASKALSQKLSKSPDEEGMGYSYKVMAFTSKDQAIPEPFPGSGIEFE